MKISIIGTGYVGLVSAVCFAAKGHSVVCYDNNPKVVELIKAGKTPIYEPKLQELFTKVLKKKQIVVKELISKTHFDSELVIIAVGTPSRNGKIDLKYIDNVSTVIAEYIRTEDKYISIVIKSTVIPGTTDTRVKSIIEKISGKTIGDFGLGMNPEFLREGNAIDDFMNPDRIVLGYEDNQTLKLLQEAYEPWDCDKIIVNSRTAEMIKYVNNALLATQISSVNEFANIAAAIGGIDFMDVINGVTLDHRWNPLISKNKRLNPGILEYLVPGSGFGGSCFPKDVMALQSVARGVGIKPDILDAVLSVNNNQPFEVVRLLKKAFGDLSGKNILILGLSFKPQTDDIRESVSLKIINKLLKYKSLLYAHDPVATDNAKLEFNKNINLTFIDSWEEIIYKVDAIIIGTNWDEYNKLKNIEYQTILKDKIIVDTKRLFSTNDFPSAKYLTIGLGLLSNS